MSWQKLGSVTVSELYAQSVPFLFINTATEAKELYILNSSGELYGYFWQAPEKDQEALMQAVNSMTLHTGIKLSFLNAVYLVDGPGSFTSLRTAISFSNTVIQELTIPIFTIPTFKYLGARAHSLNLPENTPILLKAGGNFVHVCSAQSYNDIQQLKDVLQTEPKQLIVDLMDRQEQFLETESPTHPEHSQEIYRLADLPPFLDSMQAVFAVASRQPWPISPKYYKDPVIGGPKVVKKISNEVIPFFAKSLIWISFVFIFHILFRLGFYQYAIMYANNDSFVLALGNGIFATLGWLVFLLLFLVGSVGCSRFPAKLKRCIEYVLNIAACIIFSIFIGYWFISLGVAYYSGTTLSPFLLTQVNHGLDVAVKGVSPLIWLCSLAIIALYSALTWSVFSAFKRFLQTTSLGLKSILAKLLLPLFLIVGLLLWQGQKLEEYQTINLFYENTIPIDLSESIQDPDSISAIVTKLNTFGYEYNLNSFRLLSRPNLGKNLEQFSSPLAEQTTQPNVLIVFLESFSNSMTSYYNPNYPDLTPNLSAAIDHPNTTLFTNFYNSSSPTITGLLSKLCSFLPTVVFGEIENGGVLAHHQLLCLPEILQDSGYDDVFYMHAVDKNFSNKDQLLKHMGIPHRTIYGTQELTEIISEADLVAEVGPEPLSWGYSDQQMYPIFEHLYQTAEQPFLGMITTMDTHTPYNLSQDALSYVTESGEEFDELNAIHTADYAFGKFWDNFLASEYRDNTIVVAVADHAAFPNIYNNVPGLTPQLENSLYDSNFFMLYTPTAFLPETIDTYGSGIDFLPTLLDIIGIEISDENNTFEGLSMLNERERFPSLLGGHYSQLYINQLLEDGSRLVDLFWPKDLRDLPLPSGPGAPEHLDPVEYLEFYDWKRLQLERGRLWKASYPRTQTIIRQITSAGVTEATPSLIDALTAEYADDFRQFSLDFTLTSTDSLGLSADSATTFADLEDWLDDHPTVFINATSITNTSTIVEKIAESRHAVRFITHVYSEDELATASRLGIKNIVLSTSKNTFTTEELERLATEYILYAVVVTADEAINADLISTIKNFRQHVYVENIETAEELNDLQEYGITGVYSKTLFPAEE